MKQIISAILVIISIFSFIGCSAEESIEAPANFYYCTNSVSYDDINGVIIAEVRETESVKNDLTALLNLYLQGPLRTNYRCPFPEETTIEAIVWENDTVVITASDQFSQLTGLELTLACSCLARTALELTEQRAVRIQCSDSLLDGNPSITLTLDSLLLADMTETAPETTQ